MMKNKEISKEERRAARVQELKEISGGSWEQPSLIATDPYAWLSEHEIETESSDYPEFENPLEIVVKALNKMIFPAPKKIIQPVEPTKRIAWKPGIDPESRLVPESVVPGILEGDPQKRVDQPTPSGKPTEGEATFVNFICDASWSMEEEDMGVLPGFTDCARWKMVKIIVTSLIETAKKENHYFQVIGYNTTSWEIWPGPSKEYDAAMTYFMNPPEDGRAPFLFTHDGTEAGQGMEYAYNKMEEFVVAGKWKVKSCITFVIADEDIKVGDMEDPPSRYFVGHWDEKFREYGPVYYCLTVPIDPDGNIAPRGKKLKKSIENIRRDLKKYYGNKYQTEDCATSFGLFWNPQTDSTVGAGNLVRICQGRSKNRCTGKTSKGSG
jgi:hypothetical protein